MIPECNVKGISIFELIFNSRLSFSALEVIDPELIIIKSDTQETDTSKAESLNEIYGFVYNIFPESIKPVKISSIEIENGSYKKINNNSDKFLIDSIGIINISIDDFKVTSDEKTDSLSLMFCESFEAEAEGIVKYFHETEYVFSLKKINISSEKSLIQIDSLSFLPMLPIYAFFKDKKYRSDRWRIIIPSVDIEELDFNKYIWNEKIYIKNIDFDINELNILTDMRKEPDPASDPQMPHEIISQLPFEMNIRNVNLNVDSLIVEELYPYYNTPSHLPFTNIEGTMENISSIPEQQSYENPVMIDVSAYLAGTGLLNLKMEIPLLADGIDFSYRGLLNKFEATELNSHLVISDLARVTSGKIDSVTFEVISNNGIVDVMVTPYYKDLKMESINEETMDNTGLMASLETFIANTFTIRENNPDGSGKIKSGNIVYERKKEDAFLDLVWESLKTGLGEVVGF